jgi:hypothetical protein
LCPEPDFSRPYVISADSLVVAVVAHVIIVREAELMRRIFKAKPKSFLDSPRREWQFATFAWLLRHCGGYPKFLDTTMVLPVEEHFPDRGMKGHAAVAAVFRRVRDHAGMADWPCVVEPEPSAPRESESADRLRVIRYSSVQSGADVLVAHFAHELARYLVESFDAPPPGGPDLYEPSVDLAAVFMGFGVFMANSALTTRWELNEGELAHALALFCLLRKVLPDSVDPYLNAHLRKHVRLAALDLAQYPQDFQRLRSVFAVVPADVGDCTLPTRGG